MKLATCVASSAELREYFDASSAELRVAVACEVQLQGLAAAERGQECYVDVAVLIPVDANSSGVEGFEERNENEQQRVLKVVCGKRERGRSYRLFAGREKGKSCRFAAGEVEGFAKLKP